MIHTQAARRPQCAVKWDRNLKLKLTIMRQLHLRHRQTDTDIVAYAQLMSDLEIHPRSSQLLLLNGRTTYHFMFEDVRPQGLVKFASVGL